MNTKDKRIVELEAKWGSCKRMLKDRNDQLDKAEAEVERLRGLTPHVRWALGIDAANGCTFCQEYLEGGGRESGEATSKEMQHQDEGRANAGQVISTETRVPSRAPAAANPAAQSLSRRKTTRKTARSNCSCGGYHDDGL